MKLIKEFENELLEFLDSECGDYGLSYRIDKKYTNSVSTVDVEILRDNETKTYLTFSWRNNRCYTLDGWKEKKCLHLIMGCDTFEPVSQFSSSVKYFWIKVAPELWG